MSRDDVDVVRRGWEEFARGNLAGATESLHPQIEYHPDRPDGEIFRGREAVVAGIRSWAESWDEYSIDLEELIDAGDSVVVILRERGQARGALELESQSAAVCSVRDDKIVSIRTFSSRKEALAAAKVA